MKVVEQKSALTHTNSKVTFPRLPCRGCMADCTLYAVCEGRPWKVLDPSHSYPAKLAEHGSINTLNPKKLLNSKWTAVNPTNKEKHFVVTEVEFDEEGVIVHCLIEAVMTRSSTEIDWRTLRNTDMWMNGWC
jgi:tryptophan-rich hypothetical protein